MRRTLCLTAPSVPPPVGFAGTWTLEAEYDCNTATWSYLGLIFNDCQLGAGSGVWSDWTIDGPNCYAYCTFEQSVLYVDCPTAEAAGPAANPALPVVLPVGCCCDPSTVNLCEVASFIPVAPCTCADYGWLECEGGACQPPRQAATMTVDGSEPYDALYDGCDSEPLHYTGVATLGGSTEAFSIDIEPTIGGYTVYLRYDVNECPMAGALTCLGGIWTGTVTGMCNGESISITFVGET